MRGRGTLGNAVRIGAYSSLLGFNHSVAPDLPVYQQPHTSVGITVGNDVWIGSHVIVVDGVTIGDHCVIGAGAVVTKDLPPWTVAAGNPARPLRDRRDTGPRPPRAGGSAGVPATGKPAVGIGCLGDALVRFADKARAQAGEILGCCWDGERYVDRPGVLPTVRAHCDAVEIADLLLATAPEQSAADEHVRRLAGLQDPLTGLVPEFGEPLPAADGDGFIGAGPALYHVLSVGHALDLLGTSLQYPVRGCSTDAMTSRWVAP
ncbi:acyltransferase [Streptomyces sp. NPDC101194]|uniref:acyltransferase n=1 Tax=Streptomyces sp. NPDC101194 TaxID=3366127 RepID=UPI003805A08A